MILYAHLSNGTYVKYEGMEQAAIDAMLAAQGLSATYITEAEYLAATPLPPPPTPPTQLELRAQAVALLDSAEGSAKAQRALLLALIDEVNELRQRFNDLQADAQASANLNQLKPKWALRLPLLTRTGALVKITMTDKINSGAAD